MAIAFTEKQNEIINSRKTTLLVSAAAGSGKTAVLVGHIISHICDKENPVDADRFLLVTFTNAAAAQMRERINKAIDERMDGLLEEDGFYKYLHRQQTLLSNAQISTIHRFCLDVIRNHFNATALDPSFRLADDGEIKLLKADAVKELLEKHYAANDEAFYDFVESVCVGKNDDGLEDLIFKIYESAQSHPYPVKWLDFCAENYDLGDYDSKNHTLGSVDWLFKLPEFVMLMEHKERMLKSAETIWNRGLKAVMAINGPSPYEKIYRSDREIIDALKNAGGFYETVKVWQTIKDNFASLPRIKASDFDADLIETAKECRKLYKDELRKFMGDFFTQTPDNIFEDIKAVRPRVLQFVGLTREFMEIFAAKKRERNLVDFNDLEHFALEILTRLNDDGSVSYTKAADEYSDYFEEVMVDEYQDSNMVQEMILTAVSGKYRGGDCYEKLFMVGDVKQSIYKFRMARPDLFLKKYHTFKNEQNGREKCIELSQNYRSRGEVLDSVNAVFTNIMRMDFGGIDYSDNQMLNKGREFPENRAADSKAYGTEIILLSRETEDGDKADMELAEMEAKSIAARIKELTDSEDGLPVWDDVRKSYRKAEYKDIVILLRSFSGRSDEYMRVLEEEGIPVFVQSGTGYFDAYEVNILINYLRILDNPTHDISLASVLHSAIAGLSSEELALIKIEADRNSQDRGKFLYDGLISYCKNGENKELVQKTERFLADYDTLRQRRFYTPMHKLITDILKITGYGDYCAAMPSGRKRKMNLDMLVEKARAFENTSYKGLFNFVRYIEKLKKYEIDYGEAVTAGEDDNAVRIMSIHKSKGLEFPVVILGGIGRKFNRQDSSEKVVLHADYGIGMDVVDVERRTKKSALKKSVIQRMIRLENLEEEMRVLYVAMTRAVDKLIMVGAFAGLDSKADKWESAKEATFLSLSAADCYADWIMPFADMKNFDIRKINPEEIVFDEKERQVTESAREIFLKNKDKDEVVDADLRRLIEERFSYSYAQKESARISAAVSVSELKKLSFEDEEHTDEFFMEEDEPIVPKFILESNETEAAAGDETNTAGGAAVKEADSDVKMTAPVQISEKNEESKNLGMLVGTAYHAVMENLGFDGSADYDFNSLKSLCDTLVNDGKIDGTAAKRLRFNAILDFTKTGLYRRMSTADMAGLLKREQAFVVGMDSKSVRDDWPAGELIMVQGVIDAFFEENGELVLVDYKTDRVSAEDCEEILTGRYKKQLDIYAAALSQLTGKTVKEKIIYSVGSGKEIAVK